MDGKNQRERDVMVYTYQKNTGHIEIKKGFESQLVVKLM